MKFMRLDRDKKQERCVKCNYLIAAGSFVCETDDGRYYGHNCVRDKIVELFMAMGSSGTAAASFLAGKT